jgi:hypothetical protein
LTSGFGGYVDQLKKPSWQRVDTIVDDSDDAGSRTDFADADGDATAVRGFWDSEKNDISARVVGTTQAKLKEECANLNGGEVGGTVSYALNEAITKQVQKKLRARNEAFVVIERYKTSLGPQNTTALEKLADDVAEASYDVHVLLVLQKNRVERLIADKSDVKKTLDRYIQEETDFQAEPGRTDAEKKASTERINAANKNKAELDKAGAQAETTSQEMQKAIDAATKDYDEALKNLKAKIAEKKKSEPPPAKA